MGTHLYLHGQDLPASGYTIISHMWYLFDPLVGCWDYNAITCTQRLGFSNISFIACNAIKEIKYRSESMAFLLLFSFIVFWRDFWHLYVGWCIFTPHQISMLYWWNTSKICLYNVNHIDFEFKNLFTTILCTAPYLWALMAKVVLALKTIDLIFFWICYPLSAVSNQNNVRGLFWILQSDIRKSDTINRAEALYNTGVCAAFCHWILVLTLCLTRYMMYEGFL